MTTGIVPDGAGRAASLQQRPLGRLAGEVVDVVGVEQLEADRAAERLVAGLHAGVARGHRHHGEQRADLVVLGEEAVAVGDEDAAAAVAVAGGDLGDGRAGGRGRRRRPGAGARPCGPWRRPRGGSPPRSGRGASCRVRATSTHAAPAGAGRGRRRLGRLGQAGLARGRRCGRSRWCRRRSPGCRRPRSRPERQVLDLAVVEDGVRAGLVLDEDLGQLAARCAARCRACVG